MANSPHFDDIMRFARLGQSTLQFDRKDLAGFAAIRVFDAFVLLSFSGKTRVAAEQNSRDEHKSKRFGRPHHGCSCIRVDD